MTTQEGLSGGYPSMTIVSIPSTFNFLLFSHHQTIFSWKFKRGPFHLICLWKAPWPFISSFIFYNIIFQLTFFCMSSNYVIPWCCFMVRRKALSCVRHHTYFWLFFLFIWAVCFFIPSQYMSSRRSPSHDYSRRFQMVLCRYNQSQHLVKNHKFSWWMLRSLCEDSVKNVSLISSGRKSS